MRIENKIKFAIRTSKSVFIVGHKNLDLDAIGACVGISSICDFYNKDSYIIIDDETHELGVEKILKQIKSNRKIIKSSDIPTYHHKKSLLVIVDTNKIQLLQNEKIVNNFNQNIIIDHHQETDQTITSGIRIIDEEASSACEIVAHLIEDFRVRITKDVATIILSGIILDTNNLKVKTKSKTYYAAYFLAKQGANPKKVQQYLKQDINDYITRQKVITEVNVINKKYALAVAPENTKYKREELAKIADTLLQFNNIEASFVLGNREDGGVGLSARSEGNVNVGEIAENIGGGGDNQNAAAQVKNQTLKEVQEQLLKTIE